MSFLIKILATMYSETDRVSNHIPRNEWEFSRIFSGESWSRDHVYQKGAQSGIVLFHYTWLTATCLKSSWIKGILDLAPRFTFGARSKYPVQYAADKHLNGAAQQRPWQAICYTCSVFWALHLT
jgi:hypothetical protein